MTVHMMPDAARVHPQAARRDFVLAVTRTALVRIKLLQHEIEEVGVSLSHNLITPEAAVGWLYTIGADQYVNCGFWPTKIEMGGD